MTDCTLVDNLYKVEAVETRRMERITVRDEERTRQGYDVQTCFGYNPTDKERTEVQLKDENGTLMATLTYGASATIWKINKGWKRRKDQATFGFIIDNKTGYWSKQDAPQDDGDGDAAGNDIPTSRRQRISPYVQDTRNILVFRPAHPLGEKTMATLQAALHLGIIRTFDVEASEVVVEPLPDRKNRNCFLIYEASEGGAGVLHRLTDPESDGMRRVAQTALQVMHYELRDGVWTDTEEDRGDDRCEAACYRCLLSYTNQPDHELINRRDDTVKSLLIRMCASHVELTTKGIGSPAAENGLPRPDETDFPIGGLTALAFYREQRLAVVPPDTSDADIAELEDSYLITCIRAGATPGQTEELIRAHFNP